MTDGSTSSRSEKQQDLVRYFHREYHELLLLHATGLCRRFKLDPSYADDLVQDLYCQVLIYHDSFVDNYAEKGVAYLFRSLANRMIDLSRKHDSIHRLSGMYTDRLPKTSDIYYLCTEEHHNAFLEILAGLLPIRELTVMKAYIEGYKYREIAADLGIPEGSIAVMIHRSKKIIARYFHKERQIKHL